MRKPVIAANWKMHKTHLEAIHFVESLQNRVDATVLSKVDAVICPPFTAIRSVQTTIDGDDLQIALGAQDMHWEESGAFTGEVSPQMLTKLGVKYVIVGHSERREYFDETDDSVNKKVKVALSSGLIPIMCVGESLQERESGATQEKVTSQVRAGLKGIAKEKIGEIVIAYEPIWAIGTGRTASAEDAQETIAVIRAEAARISPESAQNMRIQYGGSVKSGNISEIMSQPDIDGALVGGASLDPEEFAAILSYEVR